jgi:hypothetical protein
MPSQELGISFDEMNVMSTYFYKRTLEVRSWNLLLNPYINYGTYKYLKLKEINFDKI